MKKAVMIFILAITHLILVSCDTQNDSVKVLEDCIKTTECTYESVYTDKDDKDDLYLEIKQLIDEYAVPYNDRITVKVERDAGKIELDIDSYDEINDLDDYDFLDIMNILKQIYELLEENNAEVDRVLFRSSLTEGKSFILTYNPTNATITIHNTFSSDFTGDINHGYGNYTEVLRSYDFNTVIIATYYNDMDISLLYDEISYETFKLQITNCENSSYCNNINKNTFLDSLKALLPTFDIELSD